MRISSPTFGHAPRRSTTRSALAGWVRARRVEARRAASSTPRFFRRSPRPTPMRPRSWSRKRPPISSRQVEASQLPRTKTAMTLENVKVFIVGNPPPGYGGRYFVFLKLRTACGVEGVGEVYAATFGPKIIASMIEDVFARHFVDRNPFHI